MSDSVETRYFRAKRWTRVHLAPGLFTFSQEVMAVEDQKTVNVLLRARDVEEVTEKEAKNLNPDMFNDAEKLAEKAEKDAAKAEKEAEKAEKEAQKEAEAQAKEVEEREKAEAELAEKEKKAAKKSKK
jgi:hypothetical protein